jgi:hypothetical protein
MINIMVRVLRPDKRDRMDSYAKSRLSMNKQKKKKNDMIIRFKSV